MFMNIWVRHTLSGIIHQVGTNVFDRLELIDGHVEYINIHTQGGTHDGDYIFIDAPSPNMDIYISPSGMVTSSNPVHIGIHKSKGLSPNEDNVK